jgi:hypothetical protein
MPALTDYATVNQASRMTIATAPGAIVNPIVADMAGESAANALLMDQTATVTVDAVFDAVLDQEDSVNFLNGFTITNAETPVDLTDRAAVVASTGVTVGLEAAPLEAALEAALEYIRTNPSSCAGDNDVDSAHSLKSYFSELVRDLVNSQLKTSGLTKMLNASSVFNVDVSFEEEAAAEDMSGKLTGSAPVTIGGVIMNPPAVRKGFLTQLPDAGVQSYLRSIKTASSVGFLPMRGGQSITFVFETTVSDPGHLSLISSTGAPTTGALSWTPGSAPLTAGSSSLLVQGVNAPAGVLDSSIKRRVAVIVHLGQKDVNFQRSYDVEDLQDIEMANGASQELYGLENEIEYFAAEVAKLPYTLREYAANNDAAGPYGGVTAATTALSTAKTAASAAVAGEANLNGLTKASAAAGFVHSAPMASILAIRGDSEKAVVEYNTALALFKRATDAQNVILTAWETDPANIAGAAPPAPITPQHRNRLEAARAVLETAAANDPYLSSVNHEMIRKQMEDGELINATYSADNAEEEFVAVAPYYLEYEPIDIADATKEAIAAYNLAVQKLALEKALKAYYDASNAEYVAAPLIDRDAFQRPALTSEADLPMTYTPTIVAANVANDLHQHQATEVVE